MDKTRESYELIIASNFNPSWFSKQNESYDPLVSLIEKLKNEQIPLMMVTERTYAEIAEYLKNFNLDCPAIVEHGSAVLIPQKSDLDEGSVVGGQLCWSIGDRFSFEDTELNNGYQIKQLGCSHIEARAGLKVIQSTLRINNLKGFGDLSETEIASLTGLSIAEVKQTKTREFSEIFVTPRSVDKQEMVSTAEEFGFKALIGDRLSYLIGAEANVTKAIHWLKNHYQPRNSTSKILTVGLSGNFEDLELLEAVDIPILVSERDEIPPSLSEKKWRITQDKSLTSWIKAVREICKEYAVSI